MKGVRSKHKKGSYWGKKLNQVFFKCQFSEDFYNFYNRFEFIDHWKVNYEQYLVSFTKNEAKTK